MHNEVYGLPDDGPEGTETNSGLLRKQWNTMHTWMRRGGFLAPPGLVAFEGPAQIAEVTLQGMPSLQLVFVCVLVTPGLANLHSDVYINCVCWTDCTGLPGKHQGLVHRA
jgi:hypothetical protein